MKRTSILSALSLLTLGTFAGSATEISRSIQATMPSMSFPAGISRMKRRTVGKPHGGKRRKNPMRGTCYARHFHVPSHV